MTGLHPGLAHVGFLLGTWSGSGHGEYPTIDAFDYAESITFGHVGKPFLAYSQRTRSVGADGTGVPMHAESGYWRFPGPGRIEVVLVHPTGIVEVEEGSIELGLDGAVTIELATTHVAATVTAKRVDALERTFRIEGDRLSYRVRMAAVGLPLQHHLAGDLVRDSA